jgi:TolA-binding protein
LPSLQAVRVERREESESPPRGSAPEEVTSAPRSRLGDALAQVARLGAEIARLQQQHQRDATRIGELETELAQMQTGSVDAETRSGPRLASRPPPAGDIEVREAAARDVGGGCKDR